VTIDENLKEAEFAEVRNFWKQVYVACIRRGDSDGNAECSASAAVENFLSEHPGHFKTFDQ
jgi:hypothetical protein